MSYEIQVLGAMLRLARKREAADEAALLVRVGGTAAALRIALRRLEKEELVERIDVTHARLTMTGFAVAVAAAAAGATAKRPAGASVAPHVRGSVKGKAIARMRRRKRAA